MIQKQEQKLKSQPASFVFESYIVFSEMSFRNLFLLYCFVVSRFMFLRIKLSIFCSVERDAYTLELASVAQLAGPPRGGGGGGDCPGASNLIGPQWALKLNRPSNLIAIGRLTQGGKLKPVHFSFSEL